MLLKPTDVRIVSEMVRFEQVAESANDGPDAESKRIVDKTTRVDRRTSFLQVHPRWGIAFAP